MIEINKKDKLFLKIGDTTMKEEKIQERKDLQEYIVNSWEIFTNEIGLPSIYYIGKEISPHDSVNDRIDILAFDPNDSKMVIIELKREKEKTQLLQAISYAGMVYTWTSKDIIEKLTQTKTTDNEVLEYFRNNEIEFGIKIILIAEYFDPEIILAADWLNSEYNLDITAFKATLHKIDQKLLLEIDQRYPLMELSDAYEARKNKQSQKEFSLAKRTWEDVKIELKYDFGKNVIDYLSKKYYQGDPGRARFVTTISREGINNLCISFRYKYINIYTHVSNKEEGKNILKKVFGENFIVNEWQKGLCFNINTEEEYNKLKNWFNI
jgi:hypothetical protein